MNPPACGDLPGQLAAFLQQHGLTDARLCVGYSGGLDSTVLLHALAGLRGACGFRLEAVHVHHGLSPHADDWAQHCQSVCDALDIPLQVFRVVVQPDGEGLEAAARRQRYRVFAGLRVDAVLLAHHRDDQAETVLLQLMRGGTVRGMAAMPRVRRLNADADTRLCRPFLGVPRDELARYATSHQLVWVEDDSNSNPRYLRNLVRHQLLPPLVSQMPDLQERLCEAAAHCAEAADLLDCLAAQDAVACQGPDGLNLACLNALPEVRVRNVLRYILAQAGASLRRPALLEWMRQLRHAGAQAHVRVDFGEVSLIRAGGHVSVVPRQALSHAPMAERVWQGESSLDLGHAGWLDFVASPGTGLALAGRNVRVRQRQAGDRMRLRSGGARRALKDVLREAGIPAWQRPWLPLLEVDGEIAWVAGIGTAAEFAAAADATGYLISWNPGWRQGTW